MSGYLGKIKRRAIECQKTEGQSIKEPSSRNYSGSKFKKDGFVNRGNKNCKYTAKVHLDLDLSLGLQSPDFRRDTTI